MANPRLKRWKINMSLEENLAFLERLAEDNQFRERLRKDPRTALLEFGMAIPSEYFCPKVKLPSKRECRRVLRRFQEEIQGNTSTQMIFVFYVFLPLIPESKR